MLSSTQRARKQSLLHQVPDRLCGESDWPATKSDENAENRRVDLFVAPGFGIKIPVAQCTKRAKRCPFLAAEWTSAAPENRGRSVKAPICHWSFLDFLTEGRPRLAIASRP